MSRKKPQIARSRASGKTLRSILQSKLSEAKPYERDINKINSGARDIINKINNSARKLRVKLSPFIGGSLAKGTLVRRKPNEEANEIDIDIFIRFNREEDIDKFRSVMKATGEKFKVVHGSRDYVQIKKGSLIFEIIPVLKISAPKQARNITDLSYFHVNYVLKALKKNRKLADEIILAKSFCHGAGCYGAESYIRGFSGYALELLIIEYKTFLSFIKAIARLKNEAGQKLVIDIEKHYKRENVLREINEAKLSSPIILIDPTFKERNALAALSQETFMRFRQHCIKFLKSPSLKLFEHESVDVEKLKRKAQKKKQDFAIIEITTSRQAGDIAGTKLLKFAKLFNEEMKRCYNKPEMHFEYDERQKGKIYFSGKRIREKIIRGPPLNKAEDMIRFRKKYGAAVYEHGGRLMAKIKVNNDPITVIGQFKKMNGKRMKEMGITWMEIRG